MTVIQETSEFTRDIQKDADRHKREHTKCVTRIVEGIIKAIESSERRAGFMTVRMRLHSPVSCLEVQADVNARLLEHNVYVTKLEHIKMHELHDPNCGFICCCCASLCCPCITLPLYLCYTSLFGDEYTFDVKIDAIL